MSNDEPKTRRPKNTPFKQQRLRAWQPILTPRTVLPTLFLVGIIFIPLGVGFFLTSQQVRQIVIDYTSCTSLAPKDKLGTENVPTNVLQWSYNSTDNQCTLVFELSETFKTKVFLYYRLTNFYQNHRRYVKSISSSQLRGDAIPYSDLSVCEPLVGDKNTSRPYYPCGLVANSFFNDTISVFSINDAQKDSPQLLPFSEKGIAWPSDLENFKVTSYTSDQVVPPPSWRWIGDTYSNESLKSIATNEHLMVWLRTAALPTFLKLYSHYDTDMNPGTYQLQITDNYNVTSYGGTKSIVISTMSWLGGKNSFLGIAYMVVGTTSIALGILFFIKNIISPRKLGDPAYLSWNQPNR